MMFLVGITATLQTKHLRKLQQVSSMRWVDIVTCNSATHLLFFRATWSMLCAVKSLLRVRALYHCVLLIHLLPAYDDESHSHP